MEGRPCLVSLFFRKFEGKLTLSATFRTHNAMDAYPMNLYGLMAIQGWVAKEAGLAPGALVVISHSLGLDPKELDRALLIIGKRPFKVASTPWAISASPWTARTSWWSTASRTSP